MKKNILFLMLLGLFVACVNRNVPNENDKGTVIDLSECYLIQTFNELGEPVEAYDCMTFDSVFSMGTDDGFRDAIVWLEKSEKHPNGFITPDGDGWLLECGIL